MTVAELINELIQFPSTYKVELYSDTEIDGIAILNTTGKATTTEQVIEIPTP